MHKKNSLKVLKNLQSCNFHFKNINTYICSYYILRINQEELAKDLGVDKSTISRNIEGLIEAKILDIWETKINDNGFMYYTYRLNK